MGLNPLIAACSYTFHVFFILPQELTQKINILFLIRACVCLHFRPLTSCLSVLKVSQSCTKFYFLENCSQKTLHLSCQSPCSVVSEHLRPMGGSSLPLSTVKSVTQLSAAVFVSRTTDSTQGPTAQWVMNELPFITINQWAKPINCQPEDEFVFVRMTDCLTVQMLETAPVSRGKGGLKQSWDLFVYGVFWKKSLFFVVSSKNL